MNKNVDEIKQEIQVDIDILISDYIKYKDSGFQLSEVAKFMFDAGTQLIEAVENVKDISGVQKKEVVKSSVKEIYKKINPDIPYIPEPFETWLEDVMFDKSLDAFIDFTIKNYNNKQIFKKQ